MPSIDTHVHINFDSFAGELEAVRERWQQAGVSRLVHSCVEPSEFAAIRDIADRFEEVSFAVGLHPLSADKWHDALADDIRAKAQSDPRVVAIGETGLDFFKAENGDKQKAAFTAQLDIARDLDLPVIIHCRDAAEEMVEMLGPIWRDRGPVRGVMHCWSGTPEQTQWFLDLGFYVSFSGIVTFKSAKGVRESVKIVPDDRLLVETDCPFLAPAPHRGKRNEPAFVAHVVDRVAEIRNSDPEAIAALTTANACQLFRLH